MKLLFVIDNLSTGGAQRQMVNLALGLTKRGHQIDIFCYEPGGLLAQPLYNSGVKVFWHYKHSRFSLGVVITLWKVIHNGHYDLALSYLPTANFYTILACRLLTLRRIPVVVSERRCDLPGGATYFEKLARQFYRFANHVVANSHHQRVDLGKKYPWMVSRLSTIYNGYDLDAFFPATTEPNNHPLKILSIASVSPHKNGLCLVEALHILGDRYGSYPRVDWIGQQVLKSFRLAYLNHMKEAIALHGLEEQWQWMNQRTDIVDQLHCHDVLVHCSYGEGLPNVVCEALACGRPVIVSDTLDHARLVQHGQRGYLFNYKDPADLAEKIKMMIDLSDEERYKMGQCGRQFAEVNLSQERLTNDYEHLFTRLLE